MRTVTLLSVAITSALIIGAPPPADAKSWAQKLHREAKGAVKTVVTVAAAPLKVVAE